MWPFKKKTRKQILSEEMRRFKKRVEKRFGWKGDTFGPFVKPFVEWHVEVQGAVEWNDVTVRLFFSSDDSDMGVSI